MTETLESTAKPLLIIRPSSGWSALNLAEVWQFRDLLWTLGGRDIKLRYKQTALGVAWVIIQPLMAAGIFTVVFGMIAQLHSSGGVPYFVMAFAGQLGWALFASSLGRISTSMVGNAHLVSKVYFPRLVLPLSTMFSTLIDFAVGLALIVPMALIWGEVGWNLLMLPACVAILLMLALGIGLNFAALMVSYRDVQYILPVLLQLLMYASPVAYELAEAKERLGKHEHGLVTAYMLNPLASTLETFRWSLLGQGQPEWRHLAYAAAVAAVLLLWGAFSFKRMERQFADVI